MQEEMIDYRSRLKMLISYDQEEMRKLKDIFVAFDSDSNQDLLKLLASKMLIGENYMRCMHISSQLHEDSKYSNPRIMANLRRMNQMGLLEKKKVEKDGVAYTLSPMFEQISNAFSWVLGTQFYKAYDERLRAFVNMPKNDLKKLKEIFIIFGSDSAQQVLKYIVEDYLRGEKMTWRNDIKQNLVDEYQFDQPRISNNITRLTKCGLLVRKKEGKFVYYGLSNTFEQLTKILPLIHKYLPSIYNIDRMERAKKSINNKK